MNHREAHCYHLKLRHLPPQTPSHLFHPINKKKTKTEKPLKKLMLAVYRNRPTKSNNRDKYSVLHIWSDAIQSTGVLQIRTWQPREYKKTIKSLRKYRFAVMFNISVSWLTVDVTESDRPLLQYLSSWRLTLPCLGSTGITELHSPGFQVQYVGF